MDGDNQNTMDQISQYYDHYKDSFELQKAYIAKRDRLTLYLLLSAVVLIGFVFDPATFNEKINIIIRAHVSDLSFDIQFINTGILLLTLWLLVQYYMVVLQVEKMYKYIKECEDRLIEALPSWPISREGTYYLKSYPWLSDVVNIIFVLGIPIGFIVLAIAKIVNESYWTSNLHYVDYIVLSLLIIFSLLYISTRIFREEYFDKGHYEIKFHQRLAGYFRIKNYNAKLDNGNKLRLKDDTSQQGVFAKRLVSSSF